MASRKTKTKTNTNKDPQNITRRTIIDFTCLDYYINSCLKTITLSLSNTFSNTFRCKGKKSLKIPTIVIRMCKMKKNRHYNVKRKSTNNDLQNITQKI